MSDKTPENFDAESWKLLIRIEAKLDALAEKVEVDHKKLNELEKNQQNIERRLWMGAGGVSVIAFLSPWIMRLVFKG